MRNRSACLLFVMCAALASALASAAGSTPWPEIPSPPHAKLEWVADSMRVNGVPMRVLRFTSSEPRSAIVDYYRSYWSGGYPTKPSVRAAGNETVVGQAHGPYYLTVEVRDAPQGASQGLISVSQVAGAKIERSPGELPVMPGAKVLQVVESNDPGRRSREVFVKNPQAPPSVMSYYRAALGDAGWQLVQYTDVPREAATAGGSFAVFRRERSELQLSVAPASGGRGSLLLANLVTKDTGPQRF